MKPPKPRTIRGLQAALAVVRQRTGAEAAELYAKTSVNRRIEVDPYPSASTRDAASGWRAQTSVTEESGWALRAGGGSKALFAANSGPLPDAEGWRMLNRHWLKPGSLALPPRIRRDRSVRPNPRDTPALAPTATDDTAPLDLIGNVIDRARAMFPELRLVRARFEAGQSASVLANTRGVTGRTTRGLATVEFEVVVERAGRRQLCRLYRAARHPREFDAGALAAEITERLRSSTSAPAADADAGEIIASPALAVHLLTLLGPALRGRSGWKRLEQLRAQSPFRPADLRIVDDGGYEGGWLSAAVDDEGVPTRTVELVRNGEPGEPLLGWEDDGWKGFAAAGCRRRSGWRAPPALCHSHLFIASGEEDASAIRTGVANGCHLVDRAPSGRSTATFDATGNGEEPRFEMDVTGFAIRKGRYRGAIPRARLSGTVRQLLAGIRAIGDDLRFVPSPGAVGSPTLLLTGLPLKPL